VTQNSDSLIDATKANNLQSFRDLLDSIQGVDNQRKSLWLEIYENAVNDRQNAYQNYVALLGICENKSSEHAVHGKTMATFIERMSKSNDQLLKLAEIVNSYGTGSSTLSTDDIYDLLNKKS
jgi:hypothetical protein